MSIGTMSTTDNQEQALSATGDKAQASEAAEVDTPSAESQGDEQEKSKEDAPKEGEGDSDSEGEESLAAEERPKKKSGLQRLKERHAREMAEIRQEMKLLKSQDPKGQREENAPVKEMAEGEPKEDDFDSHKDYVKALAKWTYAQEKAQDERKSKEAQAKSAYDAQRKTSQERFEAYKKANPDFDTAIEEFVEEHGDVQRSMALIAAIDDSEAGPAVMHELLKSPDEFFRINKLSYGRACSEIGKIEARIADRASSRKIETKPTTKAPPPPKPVAAKSSGARRSIYDPDTSFREYEQLRRDQLRRKA